MYAEKESFSIHGRVESVLVAQRDNSAVSESFPSILCTIEEGIRGDKHAGSRLLDAREKALRAFGYEKGIEIANHRQFSVVSKEELDEIAANLELSGDIPYGCLGENLVVSGIPHLSDLPTGTMLFFESEVHARRKPVLVVWGQNTPCKVPGEILERIFPEAEGLAARFPKASFGKRGVVGSVYLPGVIQSGDTIIARIPHQKIYDPF